jgi:PPOX class probable FMN-dependent enzyme
MRFRPITSHDELRGIYDAPAALAVNKQKAELDAYSERFLRLCPFIVLSTSSRDGRFDCSPRGDYPGFVAVLNKHTIAIPDRPGNNRLDSLSNIIEHSAVGILALVPGFNECLHINGSALLTADDALRARFEHQNKLPKAVIVVSIQEVYFHCAKAIHRSRLWDKEAKADRSLLPSLGRILMNQIDPAQSEQEIAAVEQLIETRARTTLY